MSLYRGRPPQPLKAGGLSTAMTAKQRMRAKVILPSLEERLLNRQMGFDLSLISSSIRYVHAKHYRTYTGGFGTS